ncbi:MAG: hypothetical protein VKM34_01195 [Cyanobacteriota bacterium]|nr:hypothetical protein [Cyanobacteriota bacterium]
MSNKGLGMEMPSSEDVFLSSEIDIVTGVSTPIESTSEGMISSRFQQHSWITDDGFVHVLVNSGNSLDLYSSKDNGRTWTSIRVASNTDSSARSDGVLIDGRLTMAYSAQDDSIYVAQLAYSEVNSSWSRPIRAEVASDSNIKYSRASIAIADDGRVVVVYSARDGQTGDESLRASWSQDQGRSWREFDGELASPDGTSQMSGDVIATDDGFGLIYTEGGETSIYEQLPGSQQDTINWIEYSFEGGIQSKQLLLERGDAQNDPSGTHFSSAIDNDGDIHLATNDGEGSVVYLRYDHITGKWTEPIRLATYDTRSAGGDYMELSISAENDIIVAYNAKSGPKRYIEVSSSEDGGLSWSIDSRLTQSISDNPGNIRMETPSYIGSTLPVFQQIEVADRTQSLVYYEVDIG